MYVLQALYVMIWSHYPKIQSNLLMTMSKWSQKKFHSSWGWCMVCLQWPTSHFHGWWLLQEQNPVRSLYALILLKSFSRPIVRVNMQFRKAINFSLNVQYGSLVLATIRTNSYELHYVQSRVLFLHHYVNKLIQICIYHNMMQEIQCRIFPSIHTAEFLCI